jgi:hypothetical protein
MTNIERPTRTPLAVLMWSLASAPLVWLLLFGLFILRARVTLGRWPAPYQPDPRDLGFDLHHAAIVAGIPLMFAAVLCASSEHTHRDFGRRGQQPLQLVIDFAERHGHPVHLERCAVLTDIAAPDLETPLLNLFVGAAI